MQKRPSSRRVDGILRYRSASEGVLREARCRELSGTGLTAMIEHPVFSGELLRFDLERPGGGRSVMGLARVAWTGSDPEGIAGTQVMRIRFLSLGDSSEQALREWLDELSDVPGRTSAPLDDSAVRALSRAIADSLLPPPSAMPGAQPSDGSSSGRTPVPNRRSMPPLRGLHTRSSYDPAPSVEIFGAVAMRIAPPMPPPRTPPPASSKWPAADGSLLRSARTSAAFDHPDGFPPEWASGFGQDRFGLYADIELAGVVQRLRWIPAGKFLMGSPNDEPERFVDEIQHEVELSEGYWLGETACTHALWEAVFGEKPNRLSPLLPVQLVSWDDCQRFMERAEALSPGLGLRLPSEAEWEYACRAGTQTPFWFGGTITPAQVHYHSKGEDRREPVEVKSLPPNGWGLHEMHGNVWEWCSDRYDWYGLYERETAPDLLGTDQGMHRVMRGGSWTHEARLARSAQRHHTHRGDRLQGIGFRLARGSKNQESDPRSERVKVR